MSSREEQIAQSPIQPLDVENAVQVFDLDGKPTGVWVDAPKAGSRPHPAPVEDAAEVEADDEEA